MTDKVLTAAERIAAGQGSAPSETLNVTELVDMWERDESFTMLDVTAQDVEDYGTKWTYVIQRDNGNMCDFQFWANPKRDMFSAHLMEWTKDGPVPGVKLANDPRGKRPFLYLVPA